MKKQVYICVTESLCSTAEINTAIFLKRPKTSAFFSNLRLQPQPSKQECLKNYTEKKMPLCSTKIIHRTKCHMLRYDLFKEGVLVPKES